MENAEYTRDAGIPAVPGSAGAPSQATRVIPKFFIEARRVKHGDGYKVVDVEMVEFLIAGDARKAPIEKVTDYIRETYHEAYERWKRNQEMSVDGTVLEMWPVLTGQPALIHVLKANNVFSVEALAEIPDTALANLGMGARRLRANAQAYVESRKGSDQTERLLEENEELRAKTDLQAQQIEEINARFEKMQAGTPLPPAIMAAAPAEEPDQPDPAAPVTLGAEIRTAPETPPTVEVKWNLGKKAHEVIVDGEVVFAHADKNEAVAKAEALSKNEAAE